MRQLLLLRHAKSGRDDPNTPDFTRTLNAQGRNDAPLIGAFMAAQGLVPDQILCSPAGRTRETLSRLGPYVAATTPAFFLDALYDATVDDLVAAIAGAPADAQRLLVIGHNPSLEDLTLAIADPERSHPLALTRLRAGFSTAALAVFDLGERAFADLSEGALPLSAFVSPRSLAAR